MISTEDIARICRAANRELQIAQGDPDPSPPWEEMEDWARQAVFASVETARKVKLPEELHEHWCRRREAQGWRFGPVYDVERKTHPLLVPFSELTEGQLERDRLFLAIVGALSVR